MCVRGIQQTRASGWLTIGLMACGTMAGLFGCGMAVDDEQLATLEDQELRGVECEELLEAAAAAENPRRAEHLMQLARRCLAAQAEAEARGEEARPMRTPIDHCMEIRRLAWELDFDDPVYARLRAAYRACIDNDIDADLRAERREELCASTERERRAHGETRTHAAAVEDGDRESREADPIRGEHEEAACDILRRRIAQAVSDTHERELRAAYQRCMQAE